MSYLLDVADDTFFNAEKKIKTNVTSQEISTTVVDVSGSEITYTPHENATKVLYECILQSYHAPDASNGLNFELFEDGVGKANNYSFMITDVYTYWQTNRYIRFLIDAYTGSKTFKLKVRANGSGNESTLHETADGTIFYPIVMMTSIT